MAHFSFNQDLLNRDEVEGEEQVIGKSFNIEHEVNGEVKWIPRNKLHKILAAHENLFRKQYYQAEDIKEDYPRVENDILVWQAQKTRDENFKVEFFSCDYKLCYDGPFRHPCFAIGTLSRVDGNQVNLIEIVTVPSYDKDVINNDSAVNIFCRVDDIYQKNDIYKNSNKIILDIHSTLELPSSLPMIENIKRLLDDYENLFINVSYYGYYYAWRDEPIPRFKQNPIELVGEPSEIFDDLIINIFPSGGFAHHQRTIKTAMENIISADYQAELNRKFVIDSDSENDSDN